MIHQLSLLTLVFLTACGLTSVAPVAPLAAARAKSACTASWLFEAQVRGAATIDYSTNLDQDVSVLMPTLFPAWCERTKVASTNDGSAYSGAFICSHSGWDAVVGTAAYCSVSENDTDSQHMILVSPQASITMTASCKTTCIAAPTPKSTTP